MASSKNVKGTKNCHLSVSDLTKPKTLINDYERQETDIICITEPKITNQNFNFFNHRYYDTHINAIRGTTPKKE